MIRILLIVALNCLFLEAALAAPHARVDRPYWNFGSVTNLDELTHDFVVRNTGDSPLKIIRAVSSCSACLAVETGRMEIPPGSSNSIHCRLNLRMLNGPISRAIAVECNDPENAAFTLGISGVAVPAFQVIPQEIILDVSRGQMSASADIWPELPVHGKLTRVSCDDTNVEVIVSGTPSSRYRISTRLKTLPPRGDSVAHIIAATGDSNDPICHFNLMVHNPGVLEWLPAQLVFQRQKEEQSRVLLVKQHGTNYLTLLDAVSPSKEFHCEIEPEPFSPNYRIYVSAVEQQSTVSGFKTALVLKLKNTFNQITNMDIPVMIEAQ